MWSAANDGTVVNSKGDNEKYLLKEDKETAKNAAIFQTLYTIGLLPADVGSINRKVYKNLSNSALTSKQMDEYNALKKEKGKVTKDELLEIKGKKKKKKSRYRII